MNNEEIEKYPERIRRIKPCIDKYNCEGINYPSEKNDRKKIEKNIGTIALTVLEKIYPAFVSKHSSNHEKQVILLMIPNGQGWHYLAAKNYQHYNIIKKNNIKKNCDFYCLNCLRSFRTTTTTTKKNLNHMKNYVKINIVVIL